MIILKQKKLMEDMFTPSSSFIVCIFFKEVGERSPNFMKKKVYISYINMKAYKRYFNSKHTG